MVEFAASSEGSLPVNPENQGLGELSANFFPNLRKHDYSLEFLLEQAGIRSLSHIQYAADKAPALNADLNSFYRKGLPAIEDSNARNNFRFSVTDFFTGDLQHLELHSGAEIFARRNNIDLNLRPIGIASEADYFESATYLFRCQATERAEAAFLADSLIGFEARFLPARRNEIKPTREIDSLPREHYKNTDVGAIIAFRENPLAFQITPYWDSAAFEQAIKHLLDIAEALKKKDSIVKSELSGTAELSLYRPSYLAVLLYNNICKNITSQFEDEIPNGISAIEINREKTDCYKVRVSVLSIICEENGPSSNQKVNNLSSKKRIHRVYEFGLRRNYYGLLDLEISGCTAVPFRSLSWPDKLINYSIIRPQDS